MGPSHSTPILLLIGFLLFMESCQKRVETAAPLPAAKGIDGDLTMHPGPDDRCPVCAMTTQDKKLPAAIALKSGKTYYFCGPGCMIRAWLDPNTHLGVDRNALKTAVATEYLTGKSIDAEKAIWVWGSDVVGPMGPMPVPLENAAAKETFQKRHGGDTTFLLKEMTVEKWRGLKTGDSK